MCAGVRVCAVCVCMYVCACVCVCMFVFAHLEVMLVTSFNRQPIGPLTKVESDIIHICCSTKHELMTWMTGVRLAKVSCTHRGGVLAYRVHLRVSFRLMRVRF